ncbi:MAG: hypothetical protein AAGU75_08395 [Bacillota bacterium]
MSSLNSWIYVDYKKNIWKFWQNDNKELCCNIMFIEGKWTKEILIDKDVLGFAVCVEEDGKIHIIYSSINGEIKYCTLKDNQWIGRTLYSIDSDEFKICNLKVHVMNHEMHIFYLLINSSNHGVLMHSIWNGTDSNTTKIFDLILIPDEKENYIVKVDKESNIDVLFITNEGEDITLNYCSCKNQEWTHVKRLYCIRGRNIGFEMLNDLDNLHILNKHMEGSDYYLDYVRVGMNEDIQKISICESKKELAEPLLFQLNDRLYSCWLEENKIFYSVFDCGNWSKPTYYNRGNEYKVERYHFYTASDQETPSKEREIYGTSEINLSLFFPSQFVTSEKQILKCEVNQVKGTQRNISQLSIPEKEDSLQNLKLQLYQKKSENDQLKKTIDSLSMQLQKKQSFIDTYQKKITRIMEQKRNSDENCDMILELQQKMQSKLDYINQQLSEEKNYKESLENKLREIEEEKVMIIQQVETIAEEKELITQQVERITEEKNKLISDLETEKNKSLIERLLKGRY